MSQGLSAMQARRLFANRNAILYIVFSAAASLFLLALVQRKGHLSGISASTIAETLTGTPHAVTEQEHGYELLTHVPNSTDVGVNDPYEGYKWHSESRLRLLTACLARGDCHPNQVSIAIFSTFHCQWGYYDGYHGGEGVWCVGMMRALERQGFTVLHGGDNNWKYMYHLHRQFGDMIKVIISEPGEEQRHGTFDMYKKRPDFPLGIPAWKYFNFQYYPTGWSTVVGRAWVVCAEPRISGHWNVTVQDDGIAWVSTGAQEFHAYTDPESSDFTYLGYDMNPDPEEIHIVPWEERPYRVYIMAKYAHYFHNGDQMVYDTDFYQRAYDELKDEFPGFEFVAGIVDQRSEEDKQKWGPMPPPVVHNLGKLNATEFDAEFSKARLMLGMGAPTLSPSPYRSLAYAVPFANPHKLRDGGTNENDRSWSFVQHDSLERVPEPYVYQVQAFNYTSFVDTIRKAMVAPIEPCRFERMRHSVTGRRLSDFVNHDWKGEAAKMLELRKEGKDKQGGPSGDFEL